jgi:NAD(P)-dependent dehydrogenase (short-subunit alcohol dehydrogenase family)
MIFMDKSVVATGAASGIGAATALNFARNGANLVLVDRNPLAEVAERARSLGAAIECVEGDLADAAVCDRAIDAATATFGRIDILINNAAIGLAGSVLTTEDSVLEAIWRVNFLAPLRLARRAIPIMQRQRSGVILFTGALAGMYGMANAVAYSTTKAALINLCKALAIEHARDGIRANCVSPGPVETPMLQGAIEAFGLSRDMFRAISPAGRIATAEDVAEAHTFLASDAARSINGHVLVVDNGMYAGMFAPMPAD